MLIVTYKKNKRMGKNSCAEMISRETFKPQTSVVCSNQTAWIKLSNALTDKVPKLESWSCGIYIDHNNSW